MCPILLLQQNSWTAYNKISNFRYMHYCSLYHLPPTALIGDEYLRCLPLLLIAL